MSMAGIINLIKCLSTMQSRRQICFQLMANCRERRAARSASQVG